MPVNHRALAACGFAAAAAGALYLPGALVPGWQSIADIGSGSWWFVLTLGAAHRVCLLFGLIGIYAAVTKRRLSALGAFVVASTGNALALGAGAVQLTVLPALAGHPDGASALDCTPFYEPATASAAAFIDAACTPWDFGALEAWIGAARLVLPVGMLWTGIEVARAGGACRLAGSTLAAGSLIGLVAVAAPLPVTVARSGYFLVALAYLAIGALAGRRASRAGAA